jgi:hypothetical protein
MCSSASHRRIAGRIAAAHNAHACRKCRRPFEDGVLAFGSSGSDPRWYPDPEEARAVSPGRFVFPILVERDVSVHEVEEWLADVAPEVEAILDHLWRQREERRVTREQAADQRQRVSGYDTRRVPCFTCGKSKPCPSATCEHCGDIPVPSASVDPSPEERREFDRAYGHAAGMTF